MFAKHSEDGYRQLGEKIEMKTLAHGEKTLMTQFRLGGGATLPLHSHPHEQTGYLIAGRLTLTVGSESFEATPGDSWSIPAELEHRVDVLEDALVIEVFAPPRADYLD